MHGHAPRVRRKHNQIHGQTGGEPVIQIDKDKVLSTVVSSAIGAVVGTAVTRALYENK